MNNVEVIKQLMSLGYRLAHLEANVKRILELLEKDSK